MKRAERERLRDAHHTRERELFGLKPWDRWPMDAAGACPYAPGDTSIHAESWRRAKAIRERLLAEDPNHYRDIGG